MHTRTSFQQCKLKVKCVLQQLLFEISLQEY